MSINNIIRSVLEFAVIVFVVWGLFHEEKFALLEEKLFARIRRSRFKVIKGGNKYNVSTAIPQRKSV